ncbi:MAG: hypothetical protein NHG36_06825 [Chromatiaceae bacterium]|nr:hypothetical protein [Candidatus Thioaporhodococcus sediminis]
MRPDLSGVMIERISPRTVIALSLTADHPVPKEISDFYNGRGQYIAARAKRIFMPEGGYPGAVFEDIQNAMQARGM